MQSAPQRGAFALGLPAAIAGLGWLAFFCLAPLYPGLIDWQEVWASLPEVFARAWGDSGQFAISLSLGILPAFLLLGALWVRRPDRRVFCVLLAFAGLSLYAHALVIAQGLFQPRLLMAPSLPGLELGFMLGLAAAWLFGPALTALLARARLPVAWVVLPVAAVALLPLDWHAPLFETRLLLDDLKSLGEPLYQLIKGAIVWVPLGLLFAFAGRGEALLRWSLAALAVFALQAPLFIDRLPIGELRLLGLVCLGVWVGVRLGDRSRPQTTQPAFSPAVPRQSPPDTAEAVPSVQPGRRPPPLAIVAGLSLLVLAGLGLFDFPRWQAELALAFLLYAGLLWTWPRAWLVVVPAALPLLDLAPWTGRFFLDEFDLLLLVTGGALLLRGWGAPPRHPSPLTGAWLAAFGLCLLGGAAIHLLPLPPLDANAFAGYWSPYNGLRVLKGFVWGGLLFLLLRRVRIDSESTLRLLALGMGLALLGVGLVGVWERWLYTGLGEGGRAYRIVATFSSMHTGGGHIEAWLVAALPFLWLGAFRLRDLALAGPLAILAAYVTLYTVSRGGVLAMGVVLALLLMASVRVVWRAGSLRFAAPVALLLAVAAVLTVGLSGGHFQQRLSTVGQDWQTRVEHWQQALGMMDDGIVAGLFGMGPGSFPRVWLARGPLDNQPATYGFATDKGNTWLRLGAGETLYYAQRVPARANQTYRLSLNVRSDADQARIDTPLCEKQMLNSRRCVWFGFDVPGDGQWHGIAHTFSSGEVGGRGLFDHLPTEFVLRHAGRGGVIEVDDVQLLDEAGRNLLCNGDFSHGADCWFFKTHSHLPWHIKNLWVHLYFELGALGLALYAGLTVLALTRLSRAAWRGERAAWVLLASLAGLLTVGMFDSLLDAPRLAILLLAFTLLGAGTPWGRGKAAT